MREQGIALSGLHTPHDDLYRRYGWERAEGNKRYDFRAKDMSLRLRGGRGPWNR
jgi:predicted acetyltransferase